MAKNKVQFQKGLSLPEFLAAYGSVAQCAEALFKWRWPGGFVCPACGRSESYSRIETRGLLQCKHCRHQASLTAGTIFASTKLPLTTWFLALFLLTQQKNAISALELKRQLGVSYNTAWSLKHKILQVMLERDAERQLTGVIEIDDAYWGGECHGQKPGRGSPNKTPFVAALSKTLDGRPLALRMSVVAGFRKCELAAWTEKFVHPDSIVVTDGLACFNGVAAAGVERRSGGLPLAQHRSRQRQECPPRHLPQRQPKAPAAVPCRVLLPVQPPFRPRRHAAPPRPCRRAHPAHALPAAQVG